VAGNCAKSDGALRRAPATRQSSSGIGSSTVEKYSKEKMGPLNEAHKRSNQPRKRNVRIASPEWVETRVCVSDLINISVTE
jgi:hypothetical protein